MSVRGKSIEVKEFLVPLVKEGSLRDGFYTFMLDPLRLPDGTVGDVSRILEGKLRLEVESMDLRKVIEAAIETVRPAAEAKGVRIRPEIGQCVMLLGDAQRASSRSSGTCSPTP